jgi:GABA permease
MESCSTPQLGHGLRDRHVAMIALGGIIGAGLFVGSSASIAAAGPAILLSYVIAGLVVLMVMRMVGEMAVALPRAGAFTELARLGLGNWAGFVSGWLYWFFWVVVVAIEAIAAAALIEPFIDVPTWQIGLLLLVAMTLTNLWSARTYGEFEFWFASIKVGAIIAFIIVGIGFLAGAGSEEAGRGLANLYAQGGFAPHGLAAALAAIPSVIFSLCGAEIATVAAAESEAPTRTVARMTGSLIVRVMLFFVGSIFVILCVVPWNAIVPGQSPFVMAMEAMNIPGATLIMSVIVLTAVLSCLNSGLYVTSRILFVLARHGEAPQSLVELNARRVPVRAILFGTVFGYVAVLASIVSPDVVFAFLVNASGAVMLLIYLVLACAQIKHRRMAERSAPGSIGLRMWLFPWLSYATIAAIAGILLAMAFNAALAAQLYMSLLSAALVVAVYLVRGWWSRRDQRTLVPALARAEKSAERH